MSATLPYTLVAQLQTHQLVCVLSLAKISGAEESTPENISKPNLATSNPGSHPLPLTTTNPIDFEAMDFPITGY